MTIKSHGLSIGIQRLNDQILLHLKVQGKLTHEDYTVITPMIDAAVAEIRVPRLNVLIDGTELEGWELRAAWDDFKLGLKHGNHFEKIAIYGNRHWQETIATIGNWFVSGEVKYFDHCDEALTWLQS